VITKPQYLQMDDFLDADEYAALLELVEKRLDRMAPSSVHHPPGVEPADDYSYRRSRVDMDLDDIWGFFEERLLALLPHLRRELGVRHFELGSVERQLTAHGDGDFFARHVDENHPGTNRARAITFVYYFNAEPRGFEGGELRLYDTVERDGVIHPVETYTEVDTRANSIVFFPASASHEVMPVSTDAQGMAGLRFTVNGWFRHGETGIEALPRPTPTTLTMLQQRLLPELGMPAFAVRPVPDATRDLLEGVLDLRMDRMRPEGANATYLPSGSPDFVDLGEIGPQILEQLLPLHEEWAGGPLEPTAAYGLRIYREGQTLARHTDRSATHVVTSVLSVSQDVDRPWPLTVEVGRRSHDVYLAQGQMVTFESARLPHGRATPLQGRAYVILQLHYRPVDWPHTDATLIRRGMEEGLVDALGRPTVPLAAP
jgi:Rps23 Pro-64 3,4-dihydroxylase Tpa1-like proline 4-hydroxylase